MSSLQIFNSPAPQDQEEGDWSNCSKRPQIAAQKMIKQVNSQGFKWWTFFNLLNTVYVSHPKSRGWVLLLKSECRIDFSAGNPCVSLQGIPAISIIPYRESLQLLLFSIIPYSESLHLVLLYLVLFPTGNPCSLYYSLQGIPVVSIIPYQESLQFVLFPTWNPCASLFSIIPYRESLRLALFPTGNPSG